MKVSWDDYSQYMEKYEMLQTTNIHQPAMCYHVFVLRFWILMRNLRTNALENSVFLVHDSNRRSIC